MKAYIIIKEHPSHYLSTEAYKKCRENGERYETNKVVELDFNPCNLNYTFLESLEQYGFNIKEGATMSRLQFKKDGVKTYKSRNEAEEAIKKNADEWGIFRLGCATAEQERGAIK